MKDIISQFFHECNKFVRLGVPIIYNLVDIGFYIFCFCIYFFKPLVNSISQKQQKEIIDSKKFMKSKQEYDTLLEDIQIDEYHECE